MLRGKESLFEQAPFFMARIPLLSSDVFHSLLQCENVEDNLEKLYQTSSLIREAIAIASPSLYQAMGKIDTLSVKAKKQALSSLLKYLLRMATRATPFGLFSCVAIGKFSEKIREIFSVDKVKKYARPDMEWLFAVLNKFFSDATVLSFFSLRKNSLLMESNGRIVLPYSRRKEGKKEEISIRASPLVQSILSNTDHSIAFDKLVSSVLDQLPKLEKGKVEEVIFRLVQEEILYPTVFPSLLSKDPFSDVLQGIQEKLPDHPLAEKLRIVQTKIKEFNETALGEGEAGLLELEKIMRTEADTKTFLQVDSICKQEVTLPFSIAEEMKKSAELLWSLSKKRGFSYLRPYHEKFLEKYGLFRVVSVQELVDEIKGLGYPNYSEKPREREREQWENELLEIWSNAIYTKKREIEFTEEFFEKFHHKDPKDSAPTSFDLYCEVLASSVGDINQGDFKILLHPITGAGDGCSTFGRFLPILGEETEKDIRDFLRKEELNNFFTFFAECSYFPSSARSANVAINPNLRQKVFDLGFSSENGLVIEDIYVGATEKFLYLAVPHLQKQLSVVALNALNPDLAPPILRFMREISKDAYRFLLPFDWGNVQFFPYLPRIRYKKTIFNLATWQVTLSLIGVKTKATHEEIMKKLKIWTENWSVPRYVMMAVADNRILLDLFNPIHLREIAHSLKNNPSQGIILTEKLETSGWIKSNSGVHFSELVIPFLRTYKQTQPLSIPSPHVINPNVRFQLPGGKWIYLKLYLPEKGEVLFLLHWVIPFIQENYGALEKWFFIRYHEERRSLLRLRFELRKGVLREKFLKSIHTWASPLIQDGLLNDLSIGTYEREVERYGGIEAIEQAEEIFCADSELALWMISQIVNKETDLPDYAFVSLSIMEILKCFGLSTMDDQKKFFDQMVIDPKYLEGFRNWKNKLVAFTTKIFEMDSAFLPEAPFTKLKRAIINYQKILKLDSLINVMRSILHMHCNRIMGIDNTLEYRSYLFAQKAIVVAKNAKISIER